MAILVKGRFDTYKVNGKMIRRKTNWTSVFLTFLITVAATMAVYTFMYFLVGFGGGLLVNT